MCFIEWFQSQTLAEKLIQSQAGLRHFTPTALTAGGPREGDWSLPGQGGAVGGGPWHLPWGQRGQCEGPALVGTGEEKHHGPNGHSLRLHSGCFWNIPLPPETPAPAGPRGSPFCDAWQASSKLCTCVQLCRTVCSDLSAVGPSDPCLQPGLRSTWPRFTCYVLIREFLDMQGDWAATLPLLSTSRWSRLLCLSDSKP